VEHTCDRWFILSAKHGVVEPSQPLDWYDETLKGQGVAAKRTWSKKVLSQLTDLLGEDWHGFEFEFHAGADYRDFGVEEGLRRKGALVENPVKGLGIGRQLHFYASQR